MLHGATTNAGKTRHARLVVGYGRETNSRRPTGYGQVRRVRCREPGRRFATPGGAWTNAPVGGDAGGPRGFRCAESPRGEVASEETRNHYEEGTASVARSR